MTFLAKILHATTEKRTTNDTMTVAKRQNQNYTSMRQCASANVGYKALIDIIKDDK